MIVLLQVVGVLVIVLAFWAGRRYGNTIRYPQRRNRTPIAQPPTIPPEIHIRITIRRLPPT